MGETAMAAERTRVLRDGGGEREKQKEREGEGKCERNREIGEEGGVGGARESERIKEGGEREGGS